MVRARCPSDALVVFPRRSLQLLANQSQVRAMSSMAGRAMEGGLMPGSHAVAMLARVWRGMAGAALPHAMLGRGTGLALGGPWLSCRSRTLSLTKHAPLFAPPPTAATRRRAPSEWTARRSLASQLWAVRHRDAPGSLGWGNLVRSQLNTSTDTGIVRSTPARPHFSLRFP